MNVKTYFLPAMLAAAVLGFGGSLAAAKFLNRDFVTPAGVEGQKGKGFPVRSESVAPAEAAETLRLFGVTRGAQRAAASFTLSGRVEYRPFEIGALVEQGMLLARLDEKPYLNKLASVRGSLAEVRAGLAQAERDVTRSQGLFDRGAATKEEVERTTAGRDGLIAKSEALAAEEAELLRLLQETRLTAPVSGTITEVFKEPGEFAAAGQPIYAVSGRNAVEVELEVPEALITAFRRGKQVTVDFPLLGQYGLPGTVSSVSSGSLRSGRLFPVLVQIEPFPGLMPGLTAEVSASRNQPGGLTVPVRAVINPGGQKAFVFRIVQGTAEKVPVTVRGFHGELVLVEGLASGDQVVTEGAFRLMDGDPVRDAGGLL